jgi:hypothetical protein
METGFVGSGRPIVWTQNPHPHWISQPSNQLLTWNTATANYLPGWRCSGCGLVLMDVNRPVGAEPRPSPEGAHRIH